MKKKILMMAGSFVMGAVTVTAIRKYLKNVEKERFSSWDEAYEDEDEDEFEDFGFDEDLDMDFDFEESVKQEEDPELLDDVIDYIVVNRANLTDAQVSEILGALDHRKIEKILGVSRKGGSHE